MSGNGGSLDPDIRHIRACLQLRSYTPKISLAETWRQTSHLSLHIIPTTKHKYKTKKQEERRERDARAMKTFEAEVSSISEDMERHVLEASYTLRDGLEKAEKATSTIQAELDADDRLVQGDMEYVKVREATGGQSFQQRNWNRILIPNL